jgi:hypothetical protein
MPDPIRLREAARVIFELMSNPQSESRRVQSPAVLCLLVGFVSATIIGVFVPPKAGFNFAPEETNLLAGIPLKHSAFGPFDRTDSKLKSKTGRRQTTPSQALCASIPLFPRSASGTHLLQHPELYAGSRNVSLPRDRAPPDLALSASS